MNREKKLRIGLGTFDALKGLLIIIVVMGHSMSHYNTGDSVLLAALGLFGYLIGFGAMPVFYIVAGMSFKPKPIVPTLKKTASDLMKPFAVTGLAVAVLFPIIYYFRTHWMPSVIEETSRWVLSYILGVSAPDIYFMGYRIYECYVAWFLPTMFLGLNLLNLVLKIEKETLRHLVVIVCVVTGYLLGNAGLVFFFIAQGLLVLGFCYVGYIGKKSGFFSRAKLPWWIWLGLSLLLVLQLGKRPYSVAYVNMNESFLEYLGAVAAAVLIVLLAIRLANTQWDPPNWLVKAGVHSPWIMCIHAVELTVIPWAALPTVLPWSETVVFLVEMLLKLAVIVPVCVILKKIAQERFRKKLNQRRNSEKAL